ncbi:3-oxoacyl-[acyl-carrier-protein] reductase [Gordonia effusa NBRC 100432]|uniref:3-oxoacyl-[acyl-carrier-protein] reductase MabA n=1 Tax=Gordonia effusa NBRC 100432 TaxID=1077974 RepID=H0R6C9_9ACTN|nr:SDR family oxidoreductase [Gordonia effusa]GAB20630.1 3-oxoacyl-[acyl-carrier-protein] reductase [Gordonia effusa NBRC 100432]
MTDGKPLHGRVALVTGASRGVGAAIARRLGADGAAVAVNYRRDDQAAADTVRAIEESGGRASAYAASIDDAGALDVMVDAITADLGPVDLLVSNAGVASRGRGVVDTPEDEYLRLLSVHTLGPINLLRKVLPGMRQAQRGDVVAISSVVAAAPGPYTAPYAMAKSALETAIRTLALEERGNGIRANIVAPGLVETEMGRRLVKATTGGGSIEDLAAVMPFGRVCTPEDVAGVVAFLVSQESSYVTGQRIAVDGGGGGTPGALS